MVSFTEILGGPLAIADAEIDRQDNYDRYFGRSRDGGGSASWWPCHAALQRRTDSVGVLPLLATIPW